VASAELADLCGIINAAFGRMVEVVADAMQADACGGPGIHSPRHWLTWQTAMTDAMAGSVVHLATRRNELSATVTAMVEGRLSLALAGLIGRYVPNDCEADALDLAEVLTVNQLRRSVTRYRFDLTKPAPTGPTPSDHPSDQPAGPESESESGAETSSDSS